MSEEIVPHVWPTEFSSIVFVEDMMLVNNYRIEVGFDTSSMSPILHDVAFEKVQMFFDVLMNNAIIINKDTFECKTFKFNNNYIELPEMLNDQTLGAAIFSKLVALVKEDLEIHYVKISSDLGKGIRYTIDINCPELHILLPKPNEWWGNDDIKFAPWWKRDDPATYDELISGDKIYEGEFDWSEHFAEELEQVKQQDSKGKFQIIRGGKDEDKPSK